MDIIEKRKDYPEILATLKVIENDLKTFKDDTKDDIDEIKDDTKDIKIDMKDNYVTKTEFNPIKKVVYGAVGLILASVFGALVTLVVKL